MSQIEAISRSDAELIAAIREGDRELFRELVERHSQTVFGIAWSRLGNHSLAEEAAQETFIKAYKRLGLLHSSEKFSGWLATIARHVAINLGMRHRREMDKRDRWKLEQVEDGCGEGEGDLTNETIQQTLTNLPTVHRETLVLYYLERKSIAEAAAAIGISETAFKTRLHRARECMRSALESRLESSLEQLRPSGRFAAGVMMALPMQGPSALAGGGLFGGLVKFVPVMWPLFVIQIIAFIPGLLFARWIAGKQRENFRDPEGFRARNMALMQRSAMWFVPCILLGITFLVHSSLGTGSEWVLLRVTAACVLLSGLWSARRLRLVPNLQSFCEFVALLLMSVMLGTLDFDSPTHWWMAANGVVFLLLSGTIVRTPLQMDYSLFLRAAEGLLPHGTDPKPEQREYSREDLFRFAKFLAERYLITDWRWKGDELRLRLVPVTPRKRDGFFPFLWRNESVISLNSRGDVRAMVGESVMKDLHRLGIEAEPAELCEAVSRNVARALMEHSRGEISEAEISLGQEASDRVYLRPPEQIMATRARVWMWRLLALLILLSAFFSHRDYYSGRKFGLAPVELKETEFRQGLEDTLLSTNRYWVLLHGPYVTVKFPEGLFFSAEAVAAFHDLLRGEIAKSPATERLGQGSKALLDNKFIQRALYSGLLIVREFPSFGISVEELKQEIGSWSEKERQEYIKLWPSRGHASYTTYNTSDLNLRVAMLARCGLLKEFDFSETTSLLTASQIIEEKAPDNRWEDLDTEALRGLFLMVHRNPLRDTYDTLCILKEVGGLDQIDREECIRGLLRFHKGRGLFRKELPGEVNWNIRGGGHDAYCVVESLRMLGAVDRIRDLRHWQFRTTLFRKSENTLPQWETLEAYGLKQRVRNELGMR